MACRLMKGNVRDITHVTLPFTISSVWYSDRSYSRVSIEFSLSSHGTRSMGCCQGPGGTCVEFARIGAIKKSHDIYMGKEQSEKRCYAIDTL